MHAVSFHLKDIWLFYLQNCAPRVYLEAIKLLKTKYWIAIYDIIDYSDKEVPLVAVAQF